MTKRARAVLVWLGVIGLGVTTAIVISVVGAIEAVDYIGLV